MANSKFSTAALKILMVRPDEQANVWLLFLHHFFQSIGIAFFYVAANTIFLHTFEVTDLAWTYIYSSVTLLIIGRIYAGGEHRFSAAKFMFMVGIFVLISVILLWVGMLTFHGAWLAVLIMVWYRVLYLLCSLEFWGMTSLMFNVRQGKRLFSLISVGDVLPKVLGYSSLSFLIHVIGIDWIIPFAGLCFLISLFILRKIIKEMPKELIEHQDEQREAVASTSYLSQFFRNELIIALAGTAFLVIVAITFIEYTFLSTVKPGHSSDVEFAHFIALFFTIVYSAIIIIKIFFSSRIIKEWGIKTNLMIMPVLLLIVSLAIAFLPDLPSDHSKIVFLFSAMMVISEILKRSLHEPIFLTLFQPLSKKLRLHGHTVVKGLVEPIGYGVVGIILFWINKSSEDNNLHVINYFLFGAIIGWIIFTNIVGKQYFGVLKNAVKKRFLGDQEITIKDKNTMQILNDKLHSIHPEEVIYSIELLQKIQAPDFNEIIIKLLNHEDHNVRMQALSKVENLKIREALPNIKLIIDSGESIAMREIAIRILCSFEHEVPENILPLLHHHDIHIRKGAIVGLMTSGGVEAMLLAGQELLNFINSEKTNERVLAAEVIGDLKIKNFHQPIIRYFHDEREIVVDKAIETSGKLLNPALIPHLINFLDKPAYAERAMKSLIPFGGELLSSFEDFLKLPKLFDDTEKTLRICRICGHIHTPKSGELLIYLLNNRNIRIRNEALINLVLLKFAAPLEMRDDIIRHLEEEFEKACWCYHAYTSMSHEGFYEAFCNALLLEIHQGISKIFNLLCLIYDPAVIKKAKEGFNLHSKDQKANAMEILDNHISKKIQSRFIVLLEDIPLASKAEELSKIYHIKKESPDKIIRHVLKESDNKFNIWTQVTAIHSYCENHPEFEKNTIALFYNHPYKILRDTANHTLKGKHLAETTTNNLSEMSKHQIESESNLLEIEKVIVLKSTGLFRETPENVLVDISSIIHEERIAQGETIFNKGDLGSCMFIIYEGEVKIHDGDNVFAMMKNRDFFGELSLLDPEPRSATATAITDLLLLRIDQAPFYELMSEREEVARGILKILCRRIRNENEMILKLKSQLSSLS